MYNNVTQLPYYNDGTQWLPFGGGGGGSTVLTYSLIKDDDTDIPTDTDTILPAWDSTPTPYHDDTGSWDLTTGVYTATQAQSVMVTANISWAPNVSTIGQRFLQIIYKPAAGIAMVAKEASTQPDPNVAHTTTQEATIVMHLAVGDQTWVVVSQSSGVTIPISGGNETTLAGLQVLI